ncbi:MAG: DUF4416 family protein [Nitrospirae bacterium]|nr:DUF4416 family protein [Nitrospirota bacterium]
MQEPQLVKLFTCMLSPEVFLFEELKRELKSTFGPVDLESPVWLWQHTDYYSKEMGDGLRRKFIFFHDLIRPEALPEIKLKTIELEQRYLRKGGGRRINLDPGYLNFAKVILVSTKDFSHRLYLSHGIYGEVTLTFSGKTYQPMPYTYPDFRTPEYIDIFIRARDLYKAQMEKGIKK